MQRGNFKRAASSCAVTFTETLAVSRHMNLALG